MLGLPSLKRHRWLLIPMGVLVAPAVYAQQSDPPGVQTIGEPSAAPTINDGVEQPADMQTEDLAPATAIPVAPSAPSAPDAPSANAAPGTQPGATPGYPSQTPYSGTATAEGGQPRADGPIAAGDPPGRIGRLSFVEGGVVLRPAEQTQWQPASRNRPLTRGDSLYVAREGRAELSVGNVHVRLAAGALISLRALDDDVLQLEMHSGTLGVHVPALTHDEMIEVDVPGAATALTATGDYRFDVPSATDKSDRARTRLLVRRGKAEVRVGTESASLEGGEMLLLNPGATAPGKAIRAAAVDAFEGWCAERERVLSNKPALKYVSQQTAGYEDLDEYGTWSDTPQYGAVWRPRVVPSGWAPFAYGRWVWVAPWGWTWVDDQAWGFAPFHYGRWVYYNSAWMWAPGPLAMRPYYLPHLVTFFGGVNAGVSVGLGIGAIGWYPLGWGEPFYPGFGCSYAYLHAINRPYGNINGFVGQRIPMMNRGAPNSITAVSAQTMQSAQSIAPAHRTLPPSALNGAHVGLATPPVHPILQSYGHGVAPASHLPPPHLMNPSSLPSFRGAGRPSPMVPGTVHTESMVHQVGRPTYTGGYAHQPVITHINTPPMPIGAVQPMMPMYRPGVRIYEGPALGPYFHLGPDVHPSIGNPGFYGHYGAYYGGGGYYYGHPGGGGGGFFHGGHHGR